jgi:di/tricarboxylate transporter
VIAPIAIHAAQQVGADPRAIVMGVALAASMAFLTPIAHPVNLLVMGQAGYKSKDYLKAGLPLTVLSLALVLLLVPALWM